MVNAYLFIVSLLFYMLLFAFNQFITYDNAASAPPHQPKNMNTNMVYINKRRLINKQTIRLNMLTPKGVNDNLVANRARNIIIFVAFG